MKIIFMGTPDFAVETLEALVRAGHQVVLAVTQPDQPKGRGKSLQFPAVKQAALAHNIEVYQPKRVRRPECIAYLKNYEPELIVVAAFGQILPPAILSMPKYGCINVHASLLPKYRGAAPIQWAILNGEDMAGVTIMQMDSGIDTGDMLEKAQIPLAADETGGSLFNKLAALGAALCVQTIEKIENGTAVRAKQDEALATQVGMITKEMGRIDWNCPAVQIERLIRALDPWPSAFTHLHGKTLKIWRAKVLAGGDPKEAGTIVSCEKNSLLVQTGEGILSLKEVQLEGKKRMPIDAFLRGYPVEKGMALGMHENMHAKI